MAGRCERMTAIDQGSGEPMRGTLVSREGERGGGGREEMPEFRWGSLSLPKLQEYQEGEHRTWDLRRW